MPCKAHMALKVGLMKMFYNYLKYRSLIVESAILHGNYDNLSHA